MQFTEYIFNQIVQILTTLKADVEGEYVMKSTFFKAIALLLLVSPILDTSTQVVQVSGNHQVVVARAKKGVIYGKITDF